MKHPTSHPSLGISEACRGIVGSALAVSLTAMVGAIIPFIGICVEQRVMPDGELLLILPFAGLAHWGMAGIALWGVVPAMVVVYCFQELLLGRGAVWPTLRLVLVTQLAVSTIAMWMIDDEGRAGSLTASLITVVLLIISAVVLRAMRRE